MPAKRERHNCDGRKNGFWGDWKTIIRQGKVVVFCQICGVEKHKKSVPLVMRRLTKV